MHAIAELTAQLDRLQSELVTASATPTVGSLSAQDEGVEPEDAKAIELQAVVRSFDKPPRLNKLADVLRRHQFSDRVRHSPPRSASITDLAAGASSRGPEDADDDVEWLVLARSSVVVAQALLDDIFGRFVPLAEDLTYWDEVLSNRVYSTLHLVQTAPWRLWTFGHALYGQARDAATGRDLTLGTLSQSLRDRSLFRKIAFPHLDAKRAVSATRFLSIDSMVRQEVRLKMAALRKVRERGAKLVGMLVSEARFDNLANLSRDTQRIVALLESAASTLSAATIEEDDDDDFEGTSSVSRASGAGVASHSARETCRALIELSESGVPRSRVAIGALIKPHGRPSRLVRYWPIAVLAYFSGSTVLSYVAARRVAIDQWLTESVETVRSFWQNWIIEPVTHILATIRHDEGAEVALMSRRSLQSDVDSLERMVRDFAAENPQYLPAGQSLAQVASAVKEGDVTPVLVAYEENIKSPLRSAVSGTLVRSLLIQVQKTKVDVEVAISGIDRLLKSQELVFGFVGVSPALAILYVVGRSLAATLSGRRRRGLLAGDARLNAIKVLRNIERLLDTSCDRDDGNDGTATPADRSRSVGRSGSGSRSRDSRQLSYRRRGLILCEVQVLRSIVGKHAGKSLKRELLEDLADLERFRPTASSTTAGDGSTRRSSSDSPTANSTGLRENELEDEGVVLLNDDDGEKGESKADDVKSLRRVVDRIWRVHGTRGGLLA